MGSRGFGRPWGQYFGLLVLAVGTVALIFLALGRDSDEPTDSAEDPATSLSSNAGESSTAPTEDPTESVTDDPTEASETPSLSTTPPTVPDQVRAEFTAGDGLPKGALLVDGGENESDLRLTDKGLTHGNPTGGNLATGLIETKLDSDVQALGVRVVFAKKNPGAVTMIGWQTSIAAVLASGSLDPPSTGFRIVATPGEWTLTIISDDGVSTLAEGTYDVEPGPATFQIVRAGSQVWVIDPSGAVTTANDARVADLAGPWASWGVTESAVGQTPAVIESVWGG